MNDVLEKLQRVKIQNKTRLSKEDQQFCQIQQKLYDSTRNHFLSMFVDMETLHQQELTFYGKVQKYADRVYKQNLICMDKKKQIELMEKVHNHFIRTIISFFNRKYGLAIQKHSYERYLYILFALLMGLRKSEISGIKYTDIDYENRTLKIERQLGRSLEVDENEIAPKTRTKQEIDVKTPASNRVEKIPNFLFSEILEERKKYEKNRSRRQHGRWVFQDMDYICCSSYGRPRSTTYIYTHYKKLIEEAGLPYIRFHDLRHTYTTLLMKNDINQKAIAASLGHSKSIITFDVYTDKQALIEGGVEEIDAFIDEVHPYDSEDIQILKEKYGKKVLHRLA